MSLPAPSPAGELPPGVHSATLEEVLSGFGSSTPRRRTLGGRLERIFQIARSTRHVARFVIFGSFISAKPEPNDVDVFLLMENAFDVSELTGEARLLFDHGTAQSHFGASVFWLRRLAAMEGEEAAVEYWGIKRDGTVRGLVEVTSER